MNQQQQKKVAKINIRDQAGGGVPEESSSTSAKLLDS